MKRACRIFIPSLALFCLALPARADDNIVDAAMGDIDGDGRQDLVVLTLPEGKMENDVGIAVYLREPQYPALKQAIVFPARFWGTKSAGQQPQISILANRSIIVHTQNMSIGRTHWERTYTLAWRDGELVVAGFTYSFFDTISQWTAGRCDINLLTGEGTRNGAMLATSSQHITLAEWDDAIGLGACRMED